MGLQIQRRAHIVWEDTAPRTVFIVKKSSSLATSQKLSEIGDWCAILLGIPDPCSSSAAEAQLVRYRTVTACHQTAAIGDYDICMVWRSCPSRSDPPRQALHGI